MARRDKRLQEFAREMRKDPTRAEQQLWFQLRKSQLGVRFRRQEPIGPFIVDFVCLKLKFIIEVDGGAHDDIQKDLRRDAWLQQHGFFVLHLDNDHVLDDLDGAIALIETALRDPGSIFDPLNVAEFFVTDGIDGDLRWTDDAPKDIAQYPNPWA